MSTYPQTGLQRILAGAPDPVLRAILYDQDGEPITGDAGTVTCTITRADGTVVATDRAATDSTATVTCALTTAEALTLDVLTAVWKISGVVRHTSYHRIVGGFPFPVSLLAQRAAIGEGFDQAELRVERDRITDLVEHHTGIAWCPRYDRIEFEGHGHTRHGLPWRPVTTLREVTIGDTAVTLTDLDLDQRSGIISGVTFSGWCEVGAEHGHTAPPADLRDAMLIAAADSLLRRDNAIGSRVRSSTNDLGVTQQFSYAGDGHPTGIDEVDAVIMRYSRARI